MTFSVLSALRENAKENGFEADRKHKSISGGAVLRGHGTGVFGRLIFHTTFGGTHFHRVLFFVNHNSMRLFLVARFCPRCLVGKSFPSCFANEFHLME